MAQLSYVNRGCINSWVSADTHYTYYTDDYNLPFYEKIVLVCPPTSELCHTIPLNSVFDRSIVFTDASAVTYTFLNVFPRNTEVNTIAQICHAIDRVSHSNFITKLTHKDDYVYVSNGCVFNRDGKFILCVLKELNRQTLICPETLSTVIVLSNEFLRSKTWFVNNIRNMFNSYKEEYYSKTMMLNQGEYASPHLIDIDSFHNIGWRTNMVSLTDVVMEPETDPITNQIFI